MSLADTVVIQKRFQEIIHRAAAKAVAEEDVWVKYNIHAIPAERVIRYQYNVENRQFVKDETIVKIEKEPFTNGAMRHCFRMKKLAMPPHSASNHRFHKYGWSRALNYVAKCYMDKGEIITTKEGKDNVFTDITLQYEAMHWAEKFNNNNPPKKIDFIRAYAIEFVDRPGKPIFAVERFIAGHDPYGNGFLKHNTNSGFVDLEEHRKTPQVFSAHSFYSSQGQRLVADIQGVGDMYTDPQVLSMDYRFGDGDLGPRGMALFFKTFRHCDISDSLGIPIFPLSRNELKHQSKYSDDDSTCSEGSSLSKGSQVEGKCRFMQLDINRTRRKSILLQPTDVISDETRNTAKRSNITEISKSIQGSIRQSVLSPPCIIKRHQSDVDEISSSLEIGLRDAVFDHRAFHRLESGEVKPRHSRQYSSFNDDDDDDDDDIDVDRHVEQPHLRRETVMVTKRKPNPPMKVTDETKNNLGRVHYHLACLHGADRFPEIVQPYEENPDNTPSHDIHSVIFHLCQAASLKNVPACLALARARVGLDTSVSPLLKSNMPLDFEYAKELCKRAMTSEMSIASPKIAAGCLLYQIVVDEGTTGDVEKMRILEDILKLMKLSGEEAIMMKDHAQKQSRGKADGFHIGDKAVGNYCMEGTYYPGIILEITDNGNSVLIQYDDDGSSELLTNENVRPLEPATDILASQTTHLSDEQALGMINTDEECFFEDYDLMARLAELKAKTGLSTDTAAAAALYEQAAELAINAGKMNTANSWSLLAAKLAA